MSDQAKAPIDLPEVWLRYAQGDLRAAYLTLQDEIPPCPTICFLCQSAAEKALKGYLLGRGWGLKKIHDVAELLNYCKTYQADFDSLKAEAILLNDYILAGRYPGDFSAGDVGRAEADEAYAAAQRIVTYVAAHLKPAV